MTDAATGTNVSSDPGATEWEVGGLHVSVSFRRPSGATLRLFGRVSDGWEELLRFDDFVDGPHYHVPAEGDQIAFDRAVLGDPMDWYVTAVRDHLQALLVTAGYTRLLPDLDLEAVSAGAERIRAALVDCVPDGYDRVPGQGLQRTSA